MPALNDFMQFFDMGAQMGDGMRRQREAREAAKQQESAAQREAQGRNALAQYATKPSDEGFAAAVQYDPKTAFTIRQGAQEQAANEQTASRARLKELADLFDDATPENYGQRVAMAGQLGVDVSTVPQQFDPQWVQQQGALMKFMSSDEGIEALSTAGKIAADMGYKPGTPEFNAKATAIWQADAAKYIPVQPGGSVAEVLPGQAPRYAIGGGQATADIPNIASPDDYNRLPPGTRYRDPNGVIRQKPGGQTGSAPSGDFQSAFGSGI